MRTDEIDVFIGIDVGKSDHWATALNRDGKRLFDKALPNDETRLRDLYKRLGEHGRVLVAVDQVRHHRRPGRRRRPGHGHRRGLPARTVHETHRGPDARQRQDRRQRRRRHRRGRTHHAPHPASPGRI